MSWSCNKRTASPWEISSQQKGKEAPFPSGAVSSCSPARLARGAGTLAGVGAAGFRGDAGAPAGSACPAQSSAAGNVWELVSLLLSRAQVLGILQV